MLKSVLAVCDAGLYVDEFGNFNVYYDHYRSTPIALLNPQRIVKINEQRSLERKTDGYAVEFIDQAADWAIATHRILRPKKIEGDPENNYTPIKLDFTTGYYQAMWHARRMMAKEIHRPGELKITIGKEGRYYKPGSLIKVQHEGLKRGLGSGEIMQVIYSADGESINGFRMMEKFDIAEDRDYFIEYFVVKDNADPHVVDSTYGKTMRLISVGKYTDTLMLSMPVPVSDFYTPEIGNPLSVMYGIKLQGNVYESSRYIVSELSENADGYDLILFPYNKVIYDTTSIDDIPPYQTPILNAPPRVYGSFESLPIDGRPGKNGEDGKDGKDGKDGRDGKDGKDGAAGGDAPTYRGPAIKPGTSDGYVDGKKMNPGDYVMYIGEDSPPLWLYAYIMRWTGTVWERLARPSENPSNGWMYLDGISDLTKGAEAKVFSDVFTESIVANTAFIRKLFTMTMILRENGVIQSENNVNNPNAGFKIKADGDAVFNNLTARGTLQSNIFDATHGWQITKEGKAYLNEATIRGNLAARSIQITDFDVTPGDKLLKSNNAMVFIVNNNLTHSDSHGTEYTTVQNILGHSSPLKRLTTFARGKCNLIVDFPEGGAGNQWVDGWFKIDVNSTWVAGGQNNYADFPNGQRYIYGTWSQNGRRYTVEINLNLPINVITLWGTPFGGRVFLNTTFELRCAEENALFLGALG